MIAPLDNQRGIALVVTLLAVVLITALVVEFSYGVYIGTSNLYNWRDSQRLSLMARSGVNVSTRFLADKLNGKEYSYPGVFEFPVENLSEGLPGKIIIRLEDENAKFNLNAIVYDDNKTKHEAAYNVFKRLLKILALDERIADRLVDWIDRDSDSVAGLADSEKGVNNLPFYSVDELLLVPGLTKNDYTTLLPYVTVYGTRDHFSININGAEKPVIRCLSDEIMKSDKLAQNLINYRRSSPLQEKSDLSRVPGFEVDVGIPTGAIEVKGEYFSIKSIAEAGGVKRIIETVLYINRENAAKRHQEFWKEY